jgi:nitroreductase
MLAPTSFNIQHWRFVRISDPQLRADICRAAWGQTQVVQASELLVVTADTMAWDKSPERYWRNTDADTQAMVVGMLTEFYQGREWMQRDEAIRSAAFPRKT